jgi:PAS domain S-box-containing protein
MWTDAVRTGTPHDVQYRLRRHDGAYRWFHVVGQAMVDAEGRVTQWYGLLIDIDDRKNITEALRRTETAPFQGDAGCHGWGTRCLDCT